MNNLKLKGLILGLICLFAFNLNAQTIKENANTDVRKEQRPHKTPEEKAGRITDKMTEKLGLNEQQQADVYAVNLQEVKNRKEIRDRMKDKLQAEQMARYKTVLTSDQYAKLEKLQAEREAKRAERKGGHGKDHHGKAHARPQAKKGGKHHGGRGNAEVKAHKLTDKMSENLGLNEQQKADILAINMQEAKDRQNIRTKMEQKLRNEQMARYKTILTPEQYGAFEKSQAERQAKRAERKKMQGEKRRNLERKN